MSYAIIRNAKYKRENLKAVYRHNERKNKNYSNKDIDKTKSYLNYALKEPEFNYEKQFDKIREKYNLKGFIKSIVKKDAGCEVVDNSKRKKIISKIKKYTSEKSFILAMLGVMLLAISVNAIELACSAGLPVLFTNVLALNDVNFIEKCIYIFIYIFFFLIDDIIVFFVAMFTLNIKAISTKYTKYSHLIGGIIMLIIGILMIFKPEWLMFNF